MKGLFTRINEKINSLKEENNSLSVSEVFLKTSYESLDDIIEENELVIAHYDNDNFKMRVDGYDLVNEDTITLFIVDYNSTEKESLSGEQAKDYIEEATSFINYSKKDLASKLDESSSIFELSNFIKSSYYSLKKFNVVILTNKEYLGENIQSSSLDKKTIQPYIVDLSLLQELHVFDEAEIDTISVDITSFIHDGLDYIKCDNNGNKNLNGDEFDVYLFFAPGIMLAKLYSKYGYSLLEGNVRAYLKKTQKTNAGILDTISTKPNYFVSYNNGLSTVADDLVIQDHKIQVLKGWKIVNGGQTTATLYEAYKDHSVHFDNLMVPVKLTVIKKSKSPELLISDIAKYANTQSKVNASDLSSNEKFYITLEKYSRNLCVPQIIPGTELEKWFFERSRGQYFVEMSKNKAKENAFKKEFPRNKKFDKKLLAKAVMSWEQEPYTVSLGGERNFVVYNSRIRSNEGTYELNEAYYKECVGTVILFNAITDEVKKLHFGGYNNNITTYVMAVIANLSQYKLNLNKIWDDQDVTTELRRIIKTIAKDVYKLITDTPENDRNVAMYCRKEECWEKVKAYDYQLTIPKSLLLDEEIHLAKSSSNTNVGTKFVDIHSITADEWLKISLWGKETGLIQPKERSMAFSMYKLAKKDKKPSSKQIDFAKSVLKDAYSNGFVYEKD